MALKGGESSWRVKLIQVFLEVLKIKSLGHFLLLLLLVILVIVYVKPAHPFLLYTHIQLYSNWTSLCFSLLSLSLSIYIWSFKSHRHISKLSRMPTNPFFSTSAAFSTPSPPLCSRLWGQINNLFQLLYCITLLMNSLSLASFKFYSFLFFFCKIN